jgi:uncharacterized protein (TIGR02284 family)
MAQILATLRDLARICRDGEKLYHAAAARMRNPALRELAGEAGRARGELHREFVMLLCARGEPAAGGTFHGHVRELYANLCARFSDSDRVYLAEMENIEDRLLHAMERATLHLAPDDTLAFVRLHLPAARAMHERMRALKNASSNAGAA